nr:uncharacterized protein LOC111507888 [Leptinotarsa decemlineata]
MHIEKINRMRSSQMIVICIIIYCLRFCEGQRSELNSTEMFEDSVFLEVPKCCEDNGTMIRGTYSCTSLNSTVNYEHNYFDSNETHIDEDSVKFTPTFYQQLIFCTTGFVRVLIYHNEVAGFTYNSSIIVGTGLILPDKYCVDSSDGRIAFLTCLRLVQPLQAQVPLAYFLTLLIISTLCCFGTAVIYPYMMKLKEVHKKCFVGYSISTGFAILFEIILQTDFASSGCDFVGSLFFFCTISSFVWLACLCIDLIVRLRNLGGHISNGNRFYIYIAASLAVPSIVLMVTLLSNGREPAVPESFIKPSNGNSVCKFGGGLALFFVPIGFLVFVSLGCLAYFFYLRRQNEKYSPNDLDWVSHKHKFNYMFSQCCTLFLIRLIFFIVELIQTFLDTSFVEISPVIVLKIISSLEGFFILLVFIVHCIKKKTVAEES